MKKLSLILFSSLIAACSSTPESTGMGSVSASIAEKAGIQINAKQAATINKIDKALSEQIDEYHSELILPSAIPGIYQVYQSGGIFYTEETGTYLFMGNIYDLKAQKNTTEEALKLSSVASAMASIASTPKPSAGEAKEVQPVTAESNVSGAAQVETTDVLPSSTEVVDRWSAGYFVPDNLRGGQDSISTAAGDYGVRAFANYPRHHAGGGEAAFTEILRSYLINKVPGSSMAAVYPATGEKTTSITVFTDPTCPNCQSFHKSIPTLNDNGIEVRYVMIPRNPEQQKEVVDAINTIYCQKAGATRMVSVERLYTESRTPAVKGCEKDVMASLQEAIAFYGVTKTPQIFVEKNGVVYRGNVDPAVLIKDLEQ